MENQNPTILSFFIATWFLLLSIMFVGVKSQDQTPGLLCISECGTCPQVCSPPPSPEVALKPPPSPLPRPPLPHSTPPVQPVPPYSFFPPPGAIITPIKPPMPSSPSPPVHNYPPSFPYYFLPPLSPPLPPSRPATPPPSPPSPATPPPPSNNFNIPASVAQPAGFGQKNFSYPYYYFYVSEAASKTFCGPVLAALLISFHVFSSW